ncbi:MAG: TetR/AcrR family transcriptional regulator [Trebonia sp.]
MVTPVKGMSTRAAQAERTRRQIVETAQRLFTDQGYDATSLQMIADEMGLTKAAVYYHFPVKSEILHEAMRPGIERICILLDEAALIRGRRARVEHLVNGYVDFLVGHRHYAVMASTDPAAKRNKMGGEAVSMRRRALALLFGENPTGSERLSFNAVFSIHESLPEFVDLTDEELRESVRTTMLHILRVPS